MFQGRCVVILAYLQNKMDPGVHNFNEFHQKKNVLSRLGDINYFCLDVVGNLFCG